jgi:uncharacterized metal-binding protein YceD (DUF177 family)
MNVLKKYKISIAQMENKAHSFVMEGGDEFFKSFEMESVNGGDFTANIELVKSETMINLSFDIKGKLNLVCDRSLEDFDFNFASKEKLVLKFGDLDEDLADGIRIINRNTQLLDLSHDIYELISLTIPMKKLHPKFVDELEEVENEGFIVYSTKESNSKDSENIAIDPRWAALQEIKIRKEK